MIPPPVPANEDQRLQALIRLQLLDSPAEELFDACVRVAASAVGASRGAISLVDRERQWFKAIFGELPAQTSREVSFCGHAVAHDELLIVSDAREDPRFRDNPLVTEEGIVFYAGVPLMSHDGQPIGTLCVLHHETLELKDAQVATLMALCECIQTHLDLRLLALRLGKLGQEQRTELDLLGELERKRNELVRMGIHDASNPLTVALGTAELLQLDPFLSPSTREAARAIASATEAASRLLNDLMSIARSRASELSAHFEKMDVRPIAEALVRRLRFLSEQRGQRIRVDVRTEDTGIVGDSLLVERLLRNLLDNALKYGGPGTVTVVLAEHGPQLEISVEDDGPPIPPELRERIFDAGFRAAEGAQRSGHGLGLAFSQQAVALHGGTLDVRERGAGTGNRFVVRLPRRPPVPGTAA